MKLNVFTAAALWVLLLTFLNSLSPASASVFRDAGRWPQDENEPLTFVKICIEKETSVEQKKNNLEFLLHASNPSVDDVVGKVREAIQGSWEMGSSLRFIGWEKCDTLTPEQRAEYVGFLIHPDADNISRVGKAAKGVTNATRIKPWARGGDITWCIYDKDGPFGQWEYHFECAEEYARHEFGHLAGFLHEWRHPLTPQECSSTRGDNEQPLSGSETSIHFSDSQPYTIINPTIFDRNSLMTYDSECGDTDINESRFGSPNLSETDRMGLQEVYPEVNLHCLHTLSTYIPSK